MGQSITLWFQRSQAISSQLFSPVFEAEALRDGTVLLTILALTGGSTAQITAEQSLDPNDPNSWSTLVAVNGNAVNSFSGVLAGYVAGTTIPAGPYVRFRADILLSPGDRIVWSASVTLRE